MESSWLGHHQPTIDISINDTGGSSSRGFKLHTRFALANGMDRSVIKELILQSAIYCGVPAALEAFRAAEEVYKEIDGNAPVRSAP